MSTRRITYTALFAAITYVLTVAVRIPLPNNGYTNGSGFAIVIASCLMGWQYGAVSGAIGASLADLTLAPFWAPWTVVIKFVMAALIGIGYKKKPVIAVIFYILGGLTSVVGYYIAEAVNVGNFKTPIVSTPALVMEYILWIVVGLFISKLLENRIKL